MTLFYPHDWLIHGFGLPAIGWDEEERGDDGR